jgi:hypothetical protein
MKVFFNIYLERKMSDDKKCSATFDGGPTVIQWFSNSENGF